VDRFSAEWGDLVPTYAYRCEQCGTSFEETQSMAEHEAGTPPCPKCGGEKVVGVISTFFAKTSKKS
jgi:putative FmdB family regulatory protein